MKQIHLIAILLLLASCMPSLHSRTGDATVKGKAWDFNSGCFLLIETQDTTAMYKVSHKDFNTYEIGDSIK